MDENVKLVAVTQGAEELIGKTAQEVIAYVARVSNPSNQMNFETGHRLLKYCITNQHWSPFEHASATLEIKTSRGIAAQILRHRSFTFQEFSQRYSQAADFVKYKARRQDTKNKQNSIDDMSDYDQAWFEVAQDGVWAKAKQLYDEAIARGIAKEQARFLLPLNTATTLYMTGSVRSWIHYIELRASNGTQKEHADIAIKARSIMTEQFPDIAKAMGWVKEE